MKICASLALSAVLVFCPFLIAQQQAQPTTVSELLRILRIKTFRVRTPLSSDEVWSIKLLPRGEVKLRGNQPKGLTKGMGLLSMRDMGHGVYEFTLPERGGAYSQGDFELCKEVSCSGQYSVDWMKRPIYSADGRQCLLAEFSNLDGEKPSAYIALVRMRNKP
jgi:hypothetical protein